MSSVLIAPRNPNRVTVDPSSIPAWPRLVLAGQEKTGKTYEAARFTKSELIGQAFWIEIGEDSAHEYGPIGRYRIVQHDGTYEDILDSVRWATAQPRVADGRPNLIVLDSMTVLWDMLCDEQTLAARQKAEGKGWRVVADQDLTITGEMWNRAKDRWKAVLNVLRYHDGPVIMITRLEETVVFEGGQPTKARVWKVKAEKNLPYEATAVVQLRDFNRAFLTGVRSLNLALRPGTVETLPDIATNGLEPLFDMLGMEQRVRSTYVEPQPGAYLAELDRGAGGQQQASQQGRPTGGVPQGLPNPQQVRQEIMDAAKLGEEALHQVRMRYGTMLLERLQISGRNGMVSALEAIERALASVRQPKPAPGGQQQGPTRPAPRCTTPECATPFEGLRQYIDGFKCPQHSPQAVAEAAAAAAEEEAARAAADAAALEAEAGQMPTEAELYAALGSGRPEVEAQAARLLAGDELWSTEEPDFGSEPGFEPEDDPWDAIAAANPPARPQQPPRPEPEPEPERKLSGREKVELMLREEAELQAGVLGVALAAHLNVPPGGSPDTLPATRLKTRLLEARPRVIAALREQGRAAAAEAYERIGNICPMPNLPGLLEDPDQQAG